MKIIQFRCPVDPPAEHLRQLMIGQINTWSRLQRLADDPEYVTQPFTLGQWNTHTRQTLRSTGPTGMLFTLRWAMMVEKSQTKCWVVVRYKAFSAGLR